MSTESAHPTGATHHAGRDSRGGDTDPVAAGGIAAEAALVALRHTHLIHAWQSTDTGFEVIVGRGTVALPTQDAAGVLRLAHDLRRDQVTATGGYPCGSRTTRYVLSDGRVADRYDSLVDRYLPDHPYTVYVPGGDPCGCAAPHFAARTKTEALALAGLARVRGRCTRCGSHRPLHIDRWQPDPAIACPGCGAGTDTPAVLLCNGCHRPIRPATQASHWPQRAAWRHTATGHEFCAPDPDGQNWSGNPPLARPV